MNSIFCIKIDGKWFYKTNENSFGYVLFSRPTGEARLVEKEEIPKYKTLEFTNVDTLKKVVGSKMIVGHSSGEISGFEFGYAYATFADIVYALDWLMS